MTITGEPGIGKSWFCQQTAFELSSGRRWLRMFPTKQVKVAYLELEKQSPIAKDRFLRDDWKREYPESKGWLGYFNDESIRMDTVPGLARLEELVIDFNPKVVIVDSFATTVLDEVKPEFLKPAIMNYRFLARKYKMSFILVHHLNKGSKSYNPGTNSWEKEPLDLDNLKGNKLFNYEVDTVVGLAVRPGQIRDLIFLKHSFSTYPLSDSTPPKFRWKPETPIPFPSANNYDDIVNLIDLGVGSYLQLESISGFSRPTIIKAINDLYIYGIVNKIESKGGRGKENFVELRKY